MLTVLNFIMLQTYAMPYVEILDVLETVLLTVNYTFLFLGSRNMLENMKPYAKDRTWRRSSTPS